MDLDDLEDVTGQLLSFPDRCLRCGASAVDAHGDRS